MLQFRMKNPAFPRIRKQTILSIQHLALAHHERLIISETNRTP
jgi:hypothetical protein